MLIDIPTLRFVVAGAAMTITTWLVADDGFRTAPQLKAEGFKPLFTGEEVTQLHVATPAGGIHRAAAVVAVSELGLPVQ